MTEHQRSQDIGRRWTSGFTMIELLVALALFAILSSIAYSALQSVMTTDAAAQDGAHRLARLQALYTIMSRDLRQAVDRPVRDAFGEPLPAFEGQVGHVEFSRAGLPNPAGLHRSRIQRIAYELQDAGIGRLAWAVLDRAQDSRPRRHILIDGIDELRLRFRDDEGQWLDHWPRSDVRAGTHPPPLPAAIEITLEARDWGDIRWLFDLPRPEAQRKEAAKDAPS